MATSSPLVQNITTAVNVAKSLQWSELRNCYEKSDWFDLGAITIEDALIIAAPFVPQADMALIIVKFAVGLVDALPNGSDGNTKLNINDIIKGIAVAEGIDWNGLYDALMSANPILAATTLVEDLLDIAAPFIPIPNPVLPILNILNYVGKYVHPAGPLDISVMDD